MHPVRCPRAQGHPFDTIKVHMQRAKPGTCVCVCVCVCDRTPLASPKPSSSGWLAGQGYFLPQGALSTAPYKPSASFVACGPPFRVENPSPELSLLTRRKPQP